jgi:hypothetical protein
MTGEDHRDAVQLIVADEHLSAVAGAAPRCLSAGRREA